MSLCEHGNKRPCFACEYDGEPAGAYDYGWSSEITGKEGNKMRWFNWREHYEDNPKVTGGDNPFYDFSEPVNNMRELIRVLDPHMPHYRFNLLKSAIRWNNKPNLRYNLEKARDSIDEALLSLPEDEESG